MNERTETRVKEKLKSVLNKSECEDDIEELWQKLNGGLMWSAIY